ncbi:MAG: hypothetical protein IJ594_06320 [Oscillospiraceae bacterium]|nr:hypothetical protein [Oscillospiraceae bacterium]
MSVYREEIHLRARDVDLYRRLRTSELFRLLQEAAIRHTEQLGMGRDKTLDKGLLWVLTLQRCEIRRMPEYDEHVVLESWPGRSMHLLSPRYYAMTTAAGEELLKASAIWCLVDGASRKVVFPEKYGVVIDGVSTGGEIALPSAMRRAACTQEAAFTVPYSYVDLNGHMNNARYFDLAEDSIPAAAAGRRLRLVCTEYAAEARLGETLQVRWAAEQGELDEYYLEGGAEKTCFRMRLGYER